MDLRTYIDKLSRYHWIRRVPEAVSLTHEIGRIARAAGGPLLFENIIGYPGRRLFTGGMNRYATMALALGVYNPGCSFREIVRILAKRIVSITPRIVDGDGGRSLVREGKSVDLSELPVPWWNESDAGRYIGTWHVNITRDPRSGTGNAGVYRMQIIDRNHTTVNSSPRSHLAVHVARAERAGKLLEMAVVIGVPECVVMAGAAAFPDGVDELGVAGGLAGKPLSLNRCVSVDLAVPRDAEIVLEGIILPGKRVVDGPYMDYAGMRNTNTHAFCFRVMRIASRENAVFRGVSIGRPGAEDHRLLSVLAQLGLVDFHGSGIRKCIQNFFLERRLFTLLQASGRIFQTLHGVSG